jgi:hypothetical protein
MTQPGPLTILSLQSNRGLSMKKLLVLALVAAAIFFGFKKLFFPDYKTQAERRLHTMLDDMKEGTGVGPKQETAIALWYAGQNRLDNASLSTASNQFDHWRQEKDLYRKFDTFSIDSGEEVKEAPDPTAIFSVTIDSKPYKIRVVKARPMQWEE